MTGIFNNCLNKGIFSNDFKKACVLPLPKDRSREDPSSSYRPISLLSSLSKVFEKLLLNRINSFCKKFKTITNRPFGFQPKISCIHALIEFTEYLRNHCDKIQNTQACFVDLKKAFDTLNHEVLLIKLDRLEFRGIFHNLLKDYSTNRIQIVQNGKNR